MCNPDTVFLVISAVLGILAGVVLTLLYPAGSRVWVGKVYDFLKKYWLQALLIFIILHFGWEMLRQYAYNESGICLPF